LAKPKLLYQCQSCGALSPKWGGRCGDCGAWNSLVETLASTGKSSSLSRPGEGQGAAGVTALDQVELSPELRRPVGIAEFDRVLGGGLVEGAVVLIGGDPGIGKSTLLLQTLARLAGNGLRALYVSGEESLRQVAMRAQRLDLDLAQLRMLSETQVELIIAVATRERPQVLVIDSIQAVFTEQLPSAPGGVAQVRESAAQLVRYAKQQGAAIFLVGHVTKEGALAGPRVLEHMVDTVLYFEGESHSRFRVIRAVKNRFGAVNELGLFAMTDKGLREVTNPSAMFLSGERGASPGSVVLATWEGTRPLLVEVQALVDQSHLGNPRRVTVGLEAQRLAMLLAVLHRHGGIFTHDQDVFINAVGGVRITETGADLPVLLAVLSSLRNQPLPADLVAFGEVGLGGEVRPIQGGPERLREAAKHGFKQAIVPKANVPRGGVDGLKIQAVARLVDALAILN
jgi:DNA repair protein RadA/Sms